MTEEPICTLFRRISTEAMTCLVNCSNIIEDILLNTILEVVWDVVGRRLSAVIGDGCPLKMFDVIIEKVVHELSSSVQHLAIFLVEVLNHRVIWNCLVDVSCIPLYRHL